MKKNLEELLKQLIKLYPKYIDLSLDRMNNLLQKLDNPHLKLPPVIHIAGTNGKGSTLSYIKNILIKNNYIVHFYSSPHLKSIEERFFVSNKQITKNKLLNTLEYIKEINNNEKITFFEITTAAAFYLFAKNKADFTLLETGLGGRLDATNVVKESLIDIITPIGIDHQEFLGNNINKITNEKLGIIKSTSAVFISKQKNSTLKYIKKKIKKLENKKYFYNSNYKIIENKKNYFCIEYNKKKNYFKNPNLNGYHQFENATTAIASIIYLKELGYKIKKEFIDKGIEKTKWPGRLEKGYLKKIPVFLDGAHNVSGADQINNFFRNNKINRWLIIGMLKNKDLYNFLLKIKNIIQGVIAIRIPNEKNCYSTNEIYIVCNKLGINCIKKRNIYESNKYLEKIVKPNQIVISGSLYLVGKVRNLYI